MITATDILQASERIRSVVRHTPVMTSRGVDVRAGAQVFFKCENFQGSGSFKLRGASNFVRCIPKADLSRGVVAFSSGNHAQAVAMACRQMGVQATIVMPTDAPSAKVAGTRAQGAAIVVYDRFKEDREAIGARIALETGATLIPPYDHPWTIAGQGTAALELLQEVPDLDALVTCVGGGGLVSGCGTIAKAMRPSVRVFGVEPELASDTFQSLQKGERVEIPPSATIADGLRSPKPGAITFPIMQRILDSVLLVSEDEIKDAMRFLAMRMKIVVEPSGAVSAAAVLNRKLPGEVKRIGVVLSGGNVDAALLAEVLAEG
ncbi:MAG: pyridoxal-phosphate dependent enzyme [Acidobacteria bacterium]|nr:pyridoxal-phosphate dependent enzyme [Acidobacteriota bacterium]